MKQYKKNVENGYLDILNTVSRKLSKGISLEEYESLKETYVSESWTIKDLVEANLKTGNVRLIDGKLIAFYHLTNIGLSPEQLQYISQKAFENGATVDQIIVEIICEFMNSKV